MQLISLVDLLNSFLTVDVFLGLPFPVLIFSVVFHHSFGVFGHSHKINYVLFQTKSFECDLIDVTSVS